MRKMLLVLMLASTPAMAGPLDDDFDALVDTFNRMTNASGPWAPRNNFRGFQQPTYNNWPQGFYNVGSKPSPVPVPPKQVYNGYQPNFPFYSQGIRTPQANFLSLNWSF
jgi:hypothetical protein